MNRRTALRAALFLAAWGAFWAAISFVNGFAYQLGFRP